jgi:hypothetical protein
MMGDRDVSEGVAATRGGRVKPTLKSDAQIRTLPLPTTKPQEVYHLNIARGRGLALLVGRSGSKSWRVVWYEPVTNRRTGRVEKQPRSKALTVTVGGVVVPASFPAVTLAKAKALAVKFNVEAEQEKAAAKRAAVEAEAAKGEAFGEVAEEWLRGYVAKRKLRTAKELERQLRTNLSVWHDRPIAEIDKNAVKALMRHVAVTQRHAPMAQQLLMTIRSIFKWYRSWHKLPDGWRLDDVIEPGFKPDERKAEQKERKRVLKPVEVQALWKATEEPTPFNGLVRFLLLTTVRKAKAQQLRHDDIDAAGVWTIRSEDGEKANAGQLRLPALALKVVAAQREVPGNPYVFAGERGGGFNTSVVATKGDLDKRMQELLPEGFVLERWTLHDLRRTGRTYMARLGVDPDTAERVLGHTREKLVRTYSPDLGADDLKFFDELPDAVEERKAKALAMLADKIASIVGENVVRMHEAVHG